MLHGSHGTPYKNWYPYLKKIASKKGYVVNIPQMNFIESLDVEKTANKLIEKDLINSETTIIAHSSGSRVALGILNNLPKKIVVQKTIMVAGFSNYNLHQALFRVIPKRFYVRLFNVKWDWEKVKSSCKKFIFIYSDDDPYVPIEQVKILNEKLGGKLICILGAKHFSVNTDPRFKKFPQMVKFI